MPLPGIISMPVAQAAKMTGRSVRTIYTAIERGNLKAYRPWTHQTDVTPGAMVVMVEDLEAWLKSNPVVPKHERADDAAA